MPRHAWHLVLPVLLTLYPLHEAGAQDDISIYGRINLAIVERGGYGSGHSSTPSMNSLSSRLGFKGQETIGAGLVASFVVETGINADVGAGGFGNRETSIGLQGGFGKIRLGYMLTPFDDFHSIAGPGYFNNVSNDNINGFWANGYSNLFGAGSKPCNGSVPGTDDNNNFAFDGRYANSIRYDSPVIDDFTFSTHLALGEASDAGCRARAWSSKLQYAANGVNAGVAYDIHENARGLGLTDNIVLVTAAYRLSPDYYLAGYYQHVKYDNPGLQDLKQSLFGLIGKRHVGPHVIELAWYRAGAGQGMQTPVFSGIFVGAGAQSDLVALAYHYTLSKRTDLWAQCIQIRNGDKAGYDLGNSGKAGAAGTMGQRPRAIMAGLRHDF
jgi:predicted porin